MHFKANMGNQFGIKHSTLATKVFPSESSLILDVFRSWVPLRAIHRAITEIIYRAIYTILDDHKMDKWTKSRAISQKSQKIGNIEDLRESQCKCRAQ